MATKAHIAEQKTKKLLIELGELGITTQTRTETISPLTGEENDIELGEILKRAKKEAKEKKGDEPAAEIDSYDVVKGNMYVRTYSRTIHGDQFKALAEQFIGKPMYSKRAYSLVPSSEIKEVIVFYREKEDFEKKLDEQKPDSPLIDKERKFTDKEAALTFNVVKKGSIVIIKK